MYFGFTPGSERNSRPSARQPRVRIASLASLSTSGAIQTTNEPHSFPPSHPPTSYIPPVFLSTLGLLRSTLSRSCAAPARPHNTFISPDFIFTVIFLSLFSIRPVKDDILLPYHQTQGFSPCRLVTTGEGAFENSGRTIVSRAYLSNAYYRPTGHGSTHLALH